ncbi:hypothetical protein HX870_12265 [Pseudomonas gingeri]|uniref:hypothetical protein n=1 Tax=Pseudomonas gingeri TaxID=117681 RepID=UPI0015A1AEC4|nr:hypothetical protein [Pseudomonas gingeri]NWA23530.1 hypothetical protein [Pseudomonas gingeri]NWD68371.1 hypothetical protein [Pseudomonas gingeri]
MFDDFTSFENNNWNGWKTGSGTVERGVLETERGNTYWAGLVDMGTPTQFEPAIKKVFDIELSNKSYSVEYQFRIRTAPELNQHFLIAVTVPRHQDFRLNTYVEHETPINQWVDSKSGSSLFFSGSKEIWIGLWRSPGSINPPQWAIEFDNIRVRER